MFIAGLIWVSILAFGCGSALAVMPPPPLSNVVPGIDAKEHLVRDPEKAPSWNLPILVAPFEEQVRDFDVRGPGDEVLALAVNDDGVLLAATVDGVSECDQSGNWIQTDVKLTSAPSKVEANILLQRHLGRISDVDSSEFRFRMVGGPEEDLGLVFAK